MPKCAYCGVELPSNARFCSNCGKVPATTPEQSPQMRVSPMQSIPPPQPQSTSTSQSGQSSIQQRGTPPPTFPTSSTPSPAAVLPADRQPPAGRIPGGYTPGNNAPGNNIPPFKPSRRGWFGSVPSHWLIIGLVAIIIVASGLGILAALVHAHLTSSTTSSSQTTPGICSNQPLCTPPPNLKTPGPGGGTIIDLLVSGAVNGRLRATKVNGCGVSGSQYGLLVQGRLGGSEYDLVFTVTAYSGAGIYNTGKIAANLTKQPVALTTTWANTGNAPATATIHSNTKTGNMDITLSGVNNTVTIKGSWRCA